MSTQIDEPVCFRLRSVCLAAIEPLRDLRHVLLVAGGLVAVVALAVAFYAGAWWLTGVLWWRIEVWLGSA